jgi:D-glycero-D-manno-heptose 1,7-bisphosphate phosphatase
MIIDLMRAWSLNPQSCLLIGDQQTDLQAARRAGISARLFQGGNLSAFLAGIDEAKALTRSRQGV